jgi:hypothetical protein
MGIPSICVIYNTTSFLANIALRFEAIFIQSSPFSLHVHEYRELHSFFLGVGGWGGGELYAIKWDQFVFSLNTYLCLLKVDSGSFLNVFHMFLFYDVVILSYMFAKKCSMLMK